MPKGDFEARYGYPKEVLWEILYRRQGGRCAICGERFSSGRRPNDKWKRSKFINLDHRRPRSHGGGDELSNLDLTHKPCNSRKGDRCEGCSFCNPETGDLIPMWNDSDDIGGKPDYYIHSNCGEEYCPGTDIPHE